MSLTSYRAAPPRDKSCFALGLAAMAKPYPIAVFKRQRGGDLWSTAAFERFVIVMRGYP